MFSIAHGVNGRVRRQIHTQPDSHNPQVLIKNTTKLAARSIWQAVIVILGGIWTRVSVASLLQLSTRMSLKKADVLRADCVRKTCLPCHRHHHLAGTAGKLQGQRKGKFTSFLTFHPLPHGFSGFSLGLLTEDHHVPRVWITLLATLGLQLTEGLLRNFSSYSHACQSPWWRPHSHLPAHSLSSTSLENSNRLF